MILVSPSPGVQRNKACGAIAHDMRHKMCGYATEYRPSGEILSKHHCYGKWSGELVDPSLRDTLCHGLWLTQPCRLSREQGRVSRGWLMLLSVRFSVAVIFACLGLH